jgi:hypothetical protein
VTASWQAIQEQPYNKRKGRKEKEEKWKSVKIVKR